MKFYSILRYAIPCHAMLCYLCCVALCLLHVMFCCVVLYSGCVTLCDGRLYYICVVSCYVCIAFALCFEVRVCVCVCVFLYKAKVKAHVYTHASKCFLARVVRLYWSADFPLSFITGTRALSYSRPCASPLTGN